MKSNFDHLKKSRPWLARLSFAALLCTGAVADVPAQAAEPGSFPATITVDGSQLRRIGSGLREFLFLDIYVLGAYSQSGSCDPSAIVARDEARYIRMHMMRDIPRDRLVSNFRKSLEKNLPDQGRAELQKKVDVFLGFIKSDLPEDSVAEIFYAPGKGTIIKHQGRQLGQPVTGKDFAEVVWGAYFGPKTCCSSLKEDIIDECKAAGA